jgi:hypothetical protein
MAGIRQFFAAVNPTSARLSRIHAVEQEITERTEALTQGDDWFAFHSSHSLNGEANCPFITVFFIRNSSVFSVSSCWILNRYGLGLGSWSGGRGVCGGRFAHGHGGGAPGMNTILRVYPESGQSVIRLCNLDSSSASRMGYWLHSRMPLK